MLSDYSRRLSSASTIVTFRRSVRKTALFNFRPIFFTSRKNFFEVFTQVYMKFSNVYNAKIRIITNIKARGAVFP